ncbi:MAG: hypothetical protein ABIP90_10665 [Vicinamibacterales bacterium]
MALADIPPDGPPRRLDSWKEIAEYLRRDVRTATRWKSQGLPVHRVAGGKGRSVFAFTHEVDAWMAGRFPESEVIAAPTAAEPPRRSNRMFIVVVACGLVAIVAVAVAVSRGATPAVDLAALEATITPTYVSVADVSGVPRILHRFGPGAVPLEGRNARIEDLDADGSPNVVAAVSYYDTTAGQASGPGEFLNLSLQGDLQWRFSFNDAINFSGGQVSGPWTISDWQTEPDAGPKRIAVVAHDSTWWASVATILDAKGRRQGTFVNPGWLESVMWRSADQLAVAGFNNDRNGGMLALLDAVKLEGRAPAGDYAEYACVTCSSKVPLFYAVFPRSELNQVTSSRFNRARVSAAGDRLIVTTVEISRKGGDATAFYEFDRDLRFVQARYSDIYWSEHKRLELEGRLTHTRETCSDREGPKAVEIWDAVRGWVRTTPSGGS